MTTRNAKRYPVSKPYYRSVTVGGLAVSVIALLLILMGVGEVVAYGVATHVVDVLLPIFGLGGVGIAAWGRSRAEGPLTLTEDDTNDQAG